MNYFQQLSKSLALGAIVGTSLLAVPALADENTPASFVYSPSEGNFSQFMVEDLYPTKGDHDFNDALVAVHQIISLNSDGDALGVMVHMKVIASGARLSNNIAITLPVDPSNVVAYKDQADGVADIDSAPTISAWGSESNATYTLVTDTNAEFSSSNLVNTRGGLATEDATEYRYTFNFTSPQTLDTALAPFDIFLFRDRGDGTYTEVHLSDYAGTSKAYDYTGQFDDGSTGSRHFVDTGGVPFALLLPAETAYPKEGVAIDSLFPNIVTFGSSAGTSATDFYLSPNSSSRYAAPSGSSIPTGDFLGFSAGYEQSLPATDVCTAASSRTVPWCIPVATGSALEEILPIESGNGWVQSTSGMSFGWGAGNPAFTTARKTAGSKSIKIRKGTTWYFSPQFDTADLSEVGSEIEVDLYWPSNGANWWKVRLEFRTPTGSAIVLGEKTMGNEGLSTGWNTLNWDVPSSVRNILLGDNANYQFVFYTNNGYPANPNTHHLDYLRFAGTMTPHTTAHQEGSQGYSVATNDLMNFESTGDWSTTGASSLVTSPVSSGTKALSFYASSSGTTFITSADFSTTTLPTPTSTMGFDLYVPAPGSNPWWVGTITLKAKCPTAGISSWTTIGSGNSMANLFFGEYNHYTGNVPSNLLAAFQGTNTCALRIQMDGGQNVNLVVDRIGFL